MSIQLDCEHLFPPAAWVQLPASGKMFSSFFQNKDAWVSHESSHENLQFSCEYCDVSYTRKDNLKRHMKDKHTKLSMLDKVMIGETENLPQTS